MVGAMASVPKVVIVGAGFGGLAAAKALAGAPVEVTVVDQRNHHTFQPLLYQVATAGLDVDDICYATRGIFHRQANARALQATVTGVDFGTRMVATAEGPPLPYNHLILAIGAVTADFGVPGVDEHTFGLKSAAEAMRIRSHVLRNFERAERTADTDLRARATTIVIVGGGPTGVEMAGGFCELIDKPLRRDFPGIDADRARVVLVEGRDRLLAGFAPRLSDNAKRRLERMGVEVMLTTQVAAVEADRVRFADGTDVATKTVVWAAGVRAHPLVASLGLPTTGGGRLVVDDRLRVPGYPGVHAIGDVAGAEISAGELVPQVAPGAIQGGRYVADRISAESRAAASRTADSRTAEMRTAELRAAEPTAEPTWSNAAEPATGFDDAGRFMYVDKGSMATIGRHAAVVQMPGGVKITGFAGWVVWLGLHLVMLVGFRNRANVLVNWAWSYVTYDRGSRLIIELDGDEATGSRSWPATGS